ncbi:hypothetical protein [Luteimonas sp. MC1750]|uniref:hypothetical protein n=1 Tax=Luteimonas sp. MC1750 TaxID=2799326 RepID=UPI0018F064E8|nr:hypothetical protein [Luteimonas sp. MC1750]MBJ6983980.1 hypothetical protein [Luteimonas sp. MC1750]QQO06792.1 hypothetical protein JGR68_05040 [Luteimonas sp. MC1750]
MDRHAIKDISKYIEILGTTSAVKANHSTRIARIVSLGYHLVLFSAYRRHPSPILGRFLNRRIRKDCERLQALGERLQVLDDTNSQDPVQLHLTGLKWLCFDPLFGIRILQNLILLVGEDALPMDCIQFIEVHLSDASDHLTPAAKALSDQLRELLYLNRRNALGAIAVGHRLAAEDEGAQRGPDRSNQPLM